MIRLRFRTQLGWLLIFSVAAAPALAKAEPVPPDLLSLPRLLEEARRVNPELQAARKRWEAAQAKIPQARGLPPPRIGVEFEEIPRGGVKVKQATLMYQLIQSLPFPGKLSARQRVAVAEGAAAAAAFKQAQWELTAAVKAAYYDLFLLDREQEIAREQALWLDQTAASAVARYAAGTGSQADVLAAQARVQEAVNRLTVLGHRRQAMAAHLNHLLNRSGHALAGRPGPVPLQPVPSSPDELLATAEAAQPELLMFKASRDRADAAWALSKRELLPDLETMVELRDPAMGPVGPWDLTLALVLPFWFWTKQHYGVKAALFDKESAGAAYQAMRNEIERRIHEHWHEATAAYATAKLSEESLIPLSRQAVASALAAFSSGLGGVSDVFEALRQLNDRRQQYYEQVVMVEQHLAMLERAVGMPLGGENP